MTAGPEVRCARCGLASAGGYGYQRRRGRPTCPTCFAAETTRRDGRHAGVLWALVAATAVLALLRLPPRLVAIPFSVTGIYLIAAGFTIVHEAGHAVAAAAAGIKVLGVTIGTGPSVTVIRRPRFEITVGLLPVGGRTRMEPAVRGVRSRHAAAVLAGPLAETAAAWALIALGPQWLRFPIAWLWGFSMLTNLVIPLRSHGNDAWNFWKLLTMADEEVTALAGSADHDRDARLLNDVVRGDAEVDVATLERLRAAMKDRAAQPGSDVGMRAVALSNVAAIDVLIDDPDLLEEAERMSGEATSLLPWVAEIASTRGSVLVALGRDDEARRTLEEVVGRGAGIAAEAAHANLALLAARRGDAFAARRHLARADAVRGLPVYRRSVDAVAALDLAVVLRYWSEATTVTATATAVRGDAGRDGPLIGRSLRHLASTMDPSAAQRVVALGAAEAGVAIDLATVAQLAEALSG